MKDDTQRPDLESFSVRERGFLRRYVREKDRNKYSHLNPDELFSYTVFEADFDYGIKNKRDSFKKKYHRFAKQSYEDVGQRFSTLLEALSDDLSPTQQSILEFHIQKKFPDELSKEKPYKTLDRSELYHCLCGVTDFDQTQQFNRQVAFALEVFDMCTYIDNDVYDKKNFYQEGQANEYFGLSRQILEYLSETLLQAGDPGRAVFTKLQGEYDRVKTFQDKIASGEFPSLYDIQPDQDNVEQLYDERLNGFDTTSIVSDIVQQQYPDKKDICERVKKLMHGRQKLNDADDLLVHRNHAQSNIGADFRKGEITFITKNFHEFPEKHQNYIRDQLDKDLESGDTEEIDKILLENKVYQECVEDLRKISSQAIEVMAELRVNKDINPEQAAFLFKRLDLFVNNAIISKLEQKVSNYEARETKPSFER